MCWSLRAAGEECVYVDPVAKTISIFYYIAAYTDGARNCAAEDKMRIVGG